MQLYKTIVPVLQQLNNALMQLSNDQYKMGSRLLNNATIGAHTRHVIELFQCVLQGYETGVVNYDKRARNIALEQQKILASATIDIILNSLKKENKDLFLEAVYNEFSATPQRISTNYYREIIYNLEHTIHHMALIRIAINEITSIELPISFGVAASTLQYKKLSAQ